MERVYTINNSTLRVIFGDITTSATDVIVSSDDAFLTMGGGVSKAIWMCASEVIYKDTEKHIPASLGDVIVTSAVNLPHKYVFHAITISKDNRRIKWVDRPDDPQDVQTFIVKHTVEKCCTLLSNLGLNSIAFPATGSYDRGVFSTDQGAGLWSGSFNQKWKKIDFMLVWVQDLDDTSLNKSIVNVRQATMRYKFNVRAVCEKGIK